MMINAKVTTPLGVGIAQGRFVVLDGRQEVITSAVLVRLPINDVTRAELKKSNCMTPMAEKSGLWVFAEGDVK